MTNPNLDLVKKRRRQLEMQKAELAKKREEIGREEASLDQEEHDLAITERTLARLYDIDLPLAESPEPPRQHVKPKGTPTVLEMVNKILAAQEEQGQLFMEQREIVRAIRRRWWPNAKSQSIAPVLWRAAKMGKLRKNGTRYARVVESDETSRSIGLGHEGSNLRGPNNGGSLPLTQP